MNIIKEIWMNTPYELKKISGVANTLLCSSEEGLTKRVG